jgi:hypothetical protein
MVFYYEICHGITVYVGRDKMENEILLKYGFPEDVWFHVDNLSSAHVYLRFPTPGTKHKPLGDLSLIPEDIVNECCQLVKHNSIEGCKLNSCDVVYTPFPNLKKEASMQAGAVGYHDRKKVWKRRVEKDREIVKRIMKTKRVDEKPDYEGMLRARNAEVMKAKKKATKRRFEEQRRQKAARKAEQERLSYDRLYDDDALTSNADFAATEDASAACAYEDDFM